MSENSKPLPLADRVCLVRQMFEEKLTEVLKNSTPEAVETLRIEFLGRKGHVPGLMESLRDVAKEDRPIAGKAVNILSKEIEAEVEELKKKAKQWQLVNKLEKNQLDITLPVNNELPHGSLHPVTLMRKELLREFRRLGFSVIDGPEVDLDFYNFSSLNFKNDHPARDMQDTFFIKNRPNTVLRTHTSNIQIHAMLDHRPPLRVVAPGRTFRCDSDMTHTPMFHQLEAFVVDYNITMSDMKGIIDKFIKAIFGSSLATRLRPSFFPFVEPGGEVDMECTNCAAKGCRVCKETGWLEIGGLGMIHPNVFEAVNYDSEKYTGFAFGFGIDRMALLKYGLPDLRQLFEGNRQFLGQFPVHI